MSDFIDDELDSDDREHLFGEADTTPEAPKQDEVAEFWKVALGDNSKVATLAKKALEQLQRERTTNQGEMSAMIACVELWKEQAWKMDQMLDSLDCVKESPDIDLLDTPDKVALVVTALKQQTERAEYAVNNCQVVENARQEEMRKRDELQRKLAEKTRQSIVYYYEAAELRKQLAARDEELAKIYAMEPVATYEADTNQKQFLSDTEMSKGWRWLRKDFARDTKLIIKPTKK